MKVAIYSLKDFETPYLLRANGGQQELVLLKDPLGTDTAHLSTGCTAVSIFAGDDCSGAVLQLLAAQGVRFVAIRAAGYDNVDLPTATRLGIKVANVPAYSPYAIAEHAVALMLALNRRLVLADRQVHDWNFTVGNLVGFDLHGKTVGIIGTGKIGGKAAAILHGFGCRLLGHDLQEDPQLIAACDLRYTDLATLRRTSDIITIHTCLSGASRYLINSDRIAGMKRGVMLINTARGAVVDTGAVLAALDTGQIGSYGTDVYEHEKGVFFYDRSSQRPDDPLLQQLIAHPNVLLTPHQAFATAEALDNIAGTTFENINGWAGGTGAVHELSC